MINMPFCKICGEYHLEDDMAIDDICVNCNLTIIHNEHPKEDL
jgi:hypothetical protein